MIAQAVDYLPRDINKLCTLVCPTCPLEVECTHDKQDTFVFSLLLKQEDAFLPVLVHGQDAVQLLSRAPGDADAAAQLSKIFGSTFECLIEAYTVTDALGNVAKRFKMFNTVIR